jgi:hypothetical protein
MRRIALITTLLALGPAASAAGEEPRPFGVLDCVPRDGVRFCEGSIAKAVPTFDGVPLDVNVTLPAKPADGADGDFPLIITPHGFGGQKRDFGSPPPHEGSRRAAQRGYAVLAPTSRGFFGSCGTAEARAARPGPCARGWIHLDDIRYEIRDLQFLAGRLVDEDLVDPRQIGVFADSYGGFPSLALAILRDRTMLGALGGEENGRLVPWKSPRGAPMQIAAAAPYQTWSDLPNALLPNGRALDYTVPGRDDSVEPAGVGKLSFTAGLFATGQVAPDAGLTGYFAPPGADPRADLTSWLARLDLGEPYEGDPTVSAALGELRAYHSVLGLVTGGAPAPLLISSGWTDDLFTVVEALRVRNALRARYPRAPVALWLADFGHQRGANKDPDIAQRQERIFDWFDFYVRGKGQRPFQGIEARTQTCPATAPAGGPFKARTWAELHPGEVRLESPGPATVLSLPGNPSLGAAIDPVVAGNNPCATTPAADQGGAATYRLPAASGDGYTLLGSPTVIARYAVTGLHAQIAARLWDVAPDGTQTLVARGVYRPRGDDRQVFQLSPGAWRFAGGHLAKLELLGQDAPFLRPSNGAFAVTVSDVDLRLPAGERPGANPAVLAPAPLFLPPGARVAQDAVPLPRISVRVRYAPRAPGSRCRRWARLDLRGQDVRLVRRMSITRNSRLLARKGRRPWSILLRRGGRRTIRVEVKVRFRVEETARLPVRVRYCV